jgi:hypothetical protein
MLGVEAGLDLAADGFGDGAHQKLLSILDRYGIVFIVSP